MKRVFLLCTLSEVLKIVLKKPNKYLKLLNGRYLKVKYLSNLNENKIQSLLTGGHGVGIFFVYNLSIVVGFCRERNRYVERGELFDLLAFNII